MGVPLEERREGRTSITPEFIDELESADTCRGTVGYLHAVPGPAAGCPPGGEMVMGAFAPAPARSPLPTLPVCPSVLLPSVEFLMSLHHAVAQSAQPGSSPISPISSVCTTLCTNCCKSS